MTSLTDDSKEMIGNYIMGIFYSLFYNYIEGKSIG